MAHVRYLRVFTRKACRSRHDGHSSVGLRASHARSGCVWLPSRKYPHLVILQTLRFHLLSPMLVESKRYAKPAGTGLGAWIGGRGARSAGATGNTCLIMRDSSLILSEHVQRERSDPLRQGKKEVVLQKLLADESILSRDAYVDTPNT